ncbi:Alpha/Beta hydrolase protein [Penicillium malachiteum]|uniref:carboxypeptidase C n=1 Tax=Penicillium malachiteum TaxID=1324776 RepID=A0AAD6MUU4_9EURO|nr:Alpha/Beta hydrolase protein [Penicillium malachiteum]
MDTKSMFFFRQGFFEAREEPNSKPVTIWLNGGPGASSLAGLFGEVGPCIIGKENDDTILNPFSWTKHTNMLFIDQPAGVGLSTIEDPTMYPDSVEEASKDFTAMLEVFYGEIFPQYATNPLFIAGESFGGKYVPEYTAKLVRQQAKGAVSEVLAKVNVSGIILVDALVDATWLSIGHYDLFCTDKPPNVLHFNETVCQNMAAVIPECKRRARMCDHTLDPEDCMDAMEFCLETLEQYFQEEMAAHRHSPYDRKSPMADTRRKMFNVTNMCFTVRKGCPEPPLCGVGDSEMGDTSRYLNRPEIQQKLGFESTIPFQSINFDLNMKWSLNPKTYIPTTREITFLLDDRFESGGNVAVLVINGEYDVTVNYPGTFQEYENLPWHGQAAYQSVDTLQTWYWMDEEGVRQEGGKWKAAPGVDKNLEYLLVKDAGHMAPGDQRGAVASAVGAWLRNGGHLGDGWATD